MCASQRTVRGGGGNWGETDARRAARLAGTRECVPCEVCVTDVLCVTLQRL